MREYVVIGVGVGSFVFVERIFLWICCMWPLVIARDLGRCLQTSLDESHDHVV